MKALQMIRTDAEHEAALVEIEGYFDNEPEVGSEDANRFEILGFLIHKYEDEHCPLPDVSPVDILKFAIEDMGRSQKELADLIGASRASEVLNGKRDLTVKMIRKISSAWRIPIEALIPKHETEAA